MWSAPNTSTVVIEAADKLVVVISHVAGEVGVAAVGLHQRAVDIVAELGRPEERLLAVLPLVVLVALGARQTPLVDQPALAQRLDRRLDLVGLTRGQRRLGEEHLVRDVERGEVGLDLVQQRLDRRRLHDGELLVIRFLQERAAVRLGERLRRWASDSRPDRALRGSRRYRRPAPRDSAAAPTLPGYRPARRRR